MICTIIKRYDTSEKQKETSHSSGKYTGLMHISIIFVTLQLIVFFNETIILTKFKKLS